jgi:hypothetical protein
VGRAFFAMVALTLAFIGFALEVPLPFAGWVGVLVLGVLGVGYLGWSDRFLESYSGDLRTEQEGGGSGGFLRAELRSLVRSERDVGRPTARSPHVRRSPRKTKATPDGPPPGAGPDPNQL